MICDFARFHVLNLETCEEIGFPLAEFPDHLELFTFLAGYKPRWFADQDKANVKAAELMGDLHDRLAASGYEGHELRVMLVRLPFLMFADDTGLWGETGLFEDYLERRTAEHDEPIHTGCMDRDVRPVTSLKETERVKRGEHKPPTCQHGEWTTPEPTTSARRRRGAARPENARPSATAASDAAGLHPLITVGLDPL